MGQQFSQRNEESKRLQELGVLYSQALLMQLHCDQAVYDTVVTYRAQLVAEQRAILARMSECRPMQLRREFVWYCCLCSIP